MGKIKVWLDDERPMPDYFNTHAKTAEEAIKLLETGEVILISLDHDLGTETTGYTVAKWIEEAVFNNKIKMPKCMVHTHNPVGRENICRALQSAARFAQKGQS